MGSKMLIDFSAFIVLGLAMADGPISLITALGSALAPVFVISLTSAATIYIPSLINEQTTKKIIFIKLAAVILIIAGIVFVNL